MLGCAGRRSAWYLLHDVSRDRSLPTHVYLLMCCRDDAYDAMGQDIGSFIKILGVNEANEYFLQYMTDQGFAN